MHGWAGHGGRRAAEDSGRPRLNRPTRGRPLSCLLWRPRRSSALFLASCSVAPLPSPLASGLSALRTRLPNCLFTFSPATRRPPWAFHLSSAPRPARQQRQTRVRSTMKRPRFDTANLRRSRRSSRRKTRTMLVRQSTSSRRSKPRLCAYFSLQHQGACAYPTVFDRLRPKTKPSSVGSISAFFRCASSFLLPVCAPLERASELTLSTPQLPHHANSPIPRQDCSQLCQGTCLLSHIIPA